MPLMAEFHLRQKKKFAENCRFHMKKQLAKELHMKKPLLPREKNLPKKWL
jgi:hypothetical protein